MYSIGELRPVSESVDNKSSVNLQPIHSACYSGSKVEVTKPQRKLALANRVLIMSKNPKNQYCYCPLFNSWCHDVAGSRTPENESELIAFGKGWNMKRDMGWFVPEKCYIFTYIFRKSFLQHFFICHGILETTEYFNKYGFKPAINIWRIILHLFAIFCSDCLHRHYPVLLKVAKQAR